MQQDTTICAPATGTGTSALSIIRISGDRSFPIVSKIFSKQPDKLKESELKSQKSHTLHYGYIFEKNEIIDDVVVSLFKAPHSYTGEDSVEITCHGSMFIQLKVLELLVENGAVMAKPGEFTLRAFLNNKIDLSQAEAVADLIASNSAASHRLAINQMRGGFSNKIKSLRKDLLNLASLLELELDFGEEDVEFADRKNLKELIEDIIKEIRYLADSYTSGNVLKNGIPVTITGKPNVGKSTLMNALMEEEKAIVSEIPGTTRDAIEDTFTIEGITLRFIDTAGLRKETEDKIEILGIEKTYRKIKQSSIILYVFDASQDSVADVLKEIKELQETLEKSLEYESMYQVQAAKIIPVANKIDLLVSTPKHFAELVEMETIFISAKRKENIKMIIENLLNIVRTSTINQENIMVSNIRHYEALSNALISLEKAEEGLNNNLSSELLAIEINEALYHMGLIAGEVTNAEVLDTIFKGFCIGK